MASHPAARFAALESFVADLLQRCPMIRSIWLIGLPVDESAVEPDGAVVELIAFGDELVLRGLRLAASMHSSEFRLLVVTDGDAFQCAWGEYPAGALSRLEWRQTTAGMAYYNASSAAADAAAPPLHTRRRAVRVWHGAAS